MDPKIDGDGLPHNFNLPNFLKNLKNVELFRRKLKSFSLSRHSAVWMNIVGEIVIVGVGI